MTVNPPPTSRERSTPRAPPTLVPPLDQTFVGARPRRTRPDGEAQDTLPPWMDRLPPEEAAEWMEVMEVRRPSRRAGPSPFGLVLAGVGGAAMAAPFAFMIIAAAVVWSWVT